MPEVCDSHMLTLASKMGEGSFCFYPTTPLLFFRRQQFTDATPRVKTGLGVVDNRSGQGVRALTRGSNIYQEDPRPTTTGTEKKPPPPCPHHPPCRRSAALSPQALAKGSRASTAAKGPSAAQGPPRWIWAARKEKSRRAEVGHPSAGRGSKQLTRSKCPSLLGYMLQVSGVQLLSPPTG